MDGQRFDQITKALATGSSRRAFVRRCAAGLIGLTAVRAGAGSAHAQTCAGIQESCAEIECCAGYGCNEEKICIAAAECAQLGGGCLVDEQCCDGNVCSEDGLCVMPDEEAATALPETGAGPAAASSGWLATATAAAAGAALLAGRRVRDRAELPES
jgi:hypothetical protein